MTEQQKHTNLFDAITLSYMAHKGQTRRDLDIPYWTHVSLVSATVAEWGGSVEQILAAFVHDVIEDTEVGRTTIDALLGGQVGQIVQGLTASKEKTRSWEARKLEYIIPYVVAHVDSQVYLCKLADMHANMTSFTNSKVRTGVQTAKAKTINSYVALAHICLFHLNHLGTPEQFRVAQFNINRMFQRVIETDTCPDAILLKDINFNPGTMSDAWTWYKKLETLWEVK